jgi:putative tryptophan/tyrosine transport system substrate-binding protein
MRRREFITLLSGAAAAAWSLDAHAQESTNVVGYLHFGSPEPFARFVAAFKAGLSEGGYTEGKNVAIEYRWAEGKIDKLPALAADLVQRRVAVIATGGAEFPILAAKAATTSIPIIFVVGGDPVKLGLVSNLARPGGNLTGVNVLTSLLESKRFNLLREMIPRVETIAALVHRDRAVAEAQIAELREASAQLGTRVVIVSASTEAEFEPAFAQAAAQGAGALQVCASPLFFNRRRELVALAARHRIPAVYEWRDFAEAGGLMSYGTDLANSYHEAGRYVARILKGAMPADLPVMQTTRFEFVINLKTAKTLGLQIPPTLLARADEVIE